MTDKEILIVEDEYPVREMVAYGLRRAGFTVREAGDAQTAHAELARRQPDVLLIDWVLPDMSGLAMTRALKTHCHTRALPIIVLSARASEADKVEGLESGADDYVTKPFSIRELVARIHVLTRRTTSQIVNETIQVGRLSLNTVSQQVMFGGRPLQTRPTEYRLLELFMRNPERVYTREQIINGIRGEQAYMGDRMVDVHILRLRRALEEVGYDSLVQTVRGVGYRFSNRLEPFRDRRAPVTGSA